MKKNWGEAYFDHYVKFLRDPVDRSIFRQSTTSPSIQVLQFDKVFAECVTFASLGLSHYSSEVGHVTEVVLVADSHEEILADILANMLFYMVENQMEAGWGLAIEGIATIAPKFTKQTQKTALYLTCPTGFPDEFDSVSCGGAQGMILQAFPISDAEFRFFAENGAEKFEELLESSHVDVLHPERASVV